MKEIRVKGTYEEMGREFGKTLSQWHRTFKPTEKNLEFAYACETAVQKYAPDLLVELRALAEATKILTRDNPAVLSPQVDARIRARFKDLTAGNAGWR